MKQIFEDLKNNKSLPQFASTREAYYYVKAHKLAAPAHFYSYWNSGRDKQILRDILNDHYPPLDYCHPLEKGYPELTEYYTVAVEVFNS